MWIWALIIVSGICAASSFYMTYLAFSAGGQGVFLFALFGIFFGIMFTTAFIKVAAGKNTFLKRADAEISGKPTPITFVPHWFIMLALVIAGIGILAAILVPLFFK